MHYLICYDIRDKSRLQKVHKFVSSKAEFRQYSVYQGAFSKRELQQMRRKLESIIAEVDDVRIYAIPMPGYVKCYGDYIAQHQDDLNMVILQD